jgi:hypothetical protein
MGCPRPENEEVREATCPAQRTYKIVLLVSQVSDGELSFTMEQNP